MTKKGGGHGIVAPLHAHMPPDLHHWEKPMKFCPLPPKILAGYATVVMETKLSDKLTVLVLIQNCQLISLELKPNKGLNH